MREPARPPPASMSLIAEHLADLLLFRLLGLYLLLPGGFFLCKLHVVLRYYTEQRGGQAIGRPGGHLLVLLRLYSEVFDRRHLRPFFLFPPLGNDSHDFLMAGCQSKLNSSLDTPERARRLRSLQWVPYSGLSRGGFNPESNFKLGSKALAKASSRQRCRSNKNLAPRRQRGQLEFTGSNAKLSKGSEVA